MVYKANVKTQTRDSLPWLPLCTFRSHKNLHGSTDTGLYAPAARYRACYVVLVSLLVPVSFPSRFCFVLASFPSHSRLVPVSPLSALFLFLFHLLSRAFFPVSSRFLSRADRIPISVRIAFHCRYPRTLTLRLGVGSADPTLYHSSAIDKAPYYDVCSSEYNVDWMSVLPFSMNAEL